MSEFKNLCEAFETFEFEEIGLEEAQRRYKKKEEKYINKYLIDCDEGGFGKGFEKIDRIEKYVDQLVKRSIGSVEDLRKEEIKEDLTYKLLWKFYPNYDIPRKYRDIKEMSGFKNLCEAFETFDFEEVDLGKIQRQINKKEDKYIRKNRLDIDEGGRYQGELKIQRIGEEIQRLAARSAGSVEDLTKQAEIRQDLEHKLAWKFDPNYSIPVEYRDVRAKHYKFELIDLEEKK